MLTSTFANQLQTRKTEFSVTGHCFPYVQSLCFEYLEHEDVFRALINKCIGVYNNFTRFYLFIYLSISKIDNEERNTYCTLWKKALKNEKYVRLLQLPT